MAESVRWLVLSIVVLVGACSPRGEGSDAGATTPPTPSGSSSTPASVAARPADDASNGQDAALCVTAFADQRQLYVDAEVEVHPDHEAVFLEHCRQLPLPLQRCASPLYQLDHETECEAARADADPAAQQAWSRMFDALDGPAERLLDPLPREATE